MSSRQVTILSLPQQDRTCSAGTHWWSRTPPRPHVPPGYTADDARCECGAYIYEQVPALMQGIPPTGVGTFVPMVVH
jgi:hypothetical protein